MVLNQVIYVDRHIYRFNQTETHAKHDAVVSFKVIETSTNKSSEWEAKEDVITSVNGRQIKSKVAILSRNCYREQLQWYPIVKKSDVLKLVKLQVQGSPSQVLFIVGSTVNGKTPVTYYYLNELTRGLKAWLLVPETSLLGNELSPDRLLSYQTVDPRNTVFVSNSVAGIVSATQGGMIQTLEQFALSQGVTAQYQVNLSAEEHILSLKTQLKHLYQLPLTGLVNRSALTFDASTAALFRLAALPGIVIITLYLVLAVQVSEYKADSAKQELRVATKEANLVLNQYQEINEMIGRYGRLGENSPQSTQLLNVWKVLAPMYELGVIFSDVTQQQQTVTLRFTADSASRALQLLIKQGGVTNAKFVGSVRRQSNMDAATVQFELSANKLSLPVEDAIESVKMIDREKDKPLLETP
ncbi:hypothetical protein [Shewanella psychrotolerans]|uniref:hypothetical protein n=1 Tax=Shewanella psychrotolerans TaxID=2864206 RepID=UPI001C65F096|nr:hypothetical protein [Shewanella psychrotolerans]QYK00282.1 hypothetical protein K0I62_12785 [Shewanella psychrotolerans]